MLKVYQAKNSIKIKLPLFVSSISAGFPSPAEDFVENELDLNEFLIRHPAATFFVKVKGDSMINAGIADGDILVVDRSLDPKNNSVAIAFLDGEFVVKRICKKQSGLFLIPENSRYQPIKITEEMDFKIWGLVTFIIKKAI